VKSFTLSFYLSLVTITFGASFLAAPFTLNQIYGFTPVFFHDKKTVEKPTLMINPLIQAELDVLYEKYPHITQEDVNNVHTSASETCYSEAQNTIEDEEIRNNVLGQSMRMSVCQGVMSGMIENYLYQLGIDYYSGESGSPPILY
jgi:hypothetical protein